MVQQAKRACMQSHAVAPENAWSTAPPERVRLPVFVPPQNPTLALDELCRELGAGAESCRPRTQSCKLQAARRKVQSASYAGSGKAIRCKTARGATLGAVVGFGRFVFRDRDITWRCYSTGQDSIGSYYTSVVVNGLGWLG